MLNKKLPPTSHSTLFSVIIVTWNRVKDLSLAIDSVIRQKGVSKEIIIIDNNSTDGTTRLVEKYQQKYPVIRYLKMGENTGVIVPRNKGIMEAKGEIIFIFDDDAEIQDDEAFLKIAKKFEETGPDVITTKIINFYTQEDEGFIYAHNKRDYHDKSFFAFGFNGGSTFYKKYIFDKIGYFDEKFFRQAEEIDFSYRMLKGGFLTLYYSEIIVYHKSNPNRQSSDKINYFSLRNTLIGIWKNLPCLEAIVMSFVNLILYTHIAIRSLNFIFLLRALFSLLVNIPYIIRKRSPLTRKEVQKVFYLMTHPVSRYEEVDGEATIISYISYYLASKLYNSRNLHREPFKSFK